MRKLSSFRWALLGALTLQSVVPLPVLLAGDRFGGWSKPRPKTPIEEMAAAIDQLEKRIDTYGSVVIKQPDVWGEARWTAHRQDYEEVLRRERDNFQFTINAQIREADSAFLLNAAALGNALSAGSDKTAPTVSQVFQAPSAAGGFPQPSPIGLPTAATIVDSQDPSRTVQGVAIEPTLFLDQLSRYVEHLNQLRRINEGDDTADAPGYALNLIRLPVSVLPGDMTRNGYGAEVTLTLTPELGDDLLPETFKDFALNDVVDQLGLPLVRLAERTPWSVTERIQAEVDRDNELYKFAASQLQQSVQAKAPGQAPFIDAAMLRTAVDLADQTVGSLRSQTLAILPVEAQPEVGRRRETLRLALISQLDRSVHRDMDKLLGWARSYCDLETSATHQLPTPIEKQDLAVHQDQLLADILQETNQLPNAAEYAPTVALLGTILKNLDWSQPQLYAGPNSPFAFQTSAAIKVASEYRSLALMGQPAKAEPERTEIQSLSDQPNRRVDIARWVDQIAAKNAKDAAKKSDDVVREFAEGFARIGEAFVRRYAASEAPERRRLEVAYAVFRPIVQSASPEMTADVTGQEGWKALDRGGSMIANEISKAATAIADQISQIAIQVGNTVNQTVATNLVSSAATTTIASPRHRQARYPIAPTEIACVFGTEELIAIAQALHNSTSANGLHQIQLMDAHGFLTEELEAAYSLLTSLKKDGIYDAWTCLCPRLSRAIRQLDYHSSMEAVTALRTEFRNAIGWDAAKASPTCQALAIRALAWAILVESALLSDHLLADMERTEKAKGAAFLPGYPLAFYGPDPDPTARQAFNEYVRVRWPIHTFAVDPVNQEQNVSEAFARRRETQLALALAFTSGQIGANNFSRFSRQLDFELQTIELNRTVVGFSHGADTFGWRLYPRVQTPPIDGNAKVAFRDLLCGGPKRDHDLKQRQLEPGARELLAIVIMPSFVPYLRLDARTNWFRLTDPNRKQFTTEDSVRMGQMIQYVKHCKTQCLTEGGMTRGGDVRRLLTAVDQLEKRLPLQDTLVQIPYQNSQGGFRLFADGTKNLGPELIGFYGEPGYNSAQGSEIFLVGDNFNVNVTKVIVGGKQCEYKLLSRQVMKVAMPAALTTMKIQQFYDGVAQEVDVVDAHVATPYGVSSHLYVPVVSQAAPKANSRAFSPAEVFGCLTYDGCFANGLQISDNVVKLTGLPEGKPGVLTISATALFGDGKERTLTRYTEVLGKPVQDPEWPVTLLGETGNTFTFSRERLALEIQPFFTGNVAPRAQENVAALRITARLSVEGGPPGDVTPLLIKIGCANRDCATCPVSAPAPAPACQACPIPAACPAGCPSLSWGALGPAPAAGGGSALTKPGSAKTEVMRVEFPPVRSDNPAAVPAPQETTPFPVLAPPAGAAPPTGVGAGADDAVPVPNASQGASPVRSAKGWLPVFGGSRR